MFQADSGPVAGQPGASSGTQGLSAVMDMFGNIGHVAMAVLVLLLIASLYSWMLILGKMSVLGKATGDSRKFIRAFRKATRLQEITALCEQFKYSPMARVFEDVYETYRRQTGGAGPPRNLTPLERSAQSAANEAITNFESRMTWLATIAAISPFVGLFGTVIGVIDAFHGLGTAGAATLRAVAPGISEALITTAAGLFVAVPAVVAYNQFSGRIRVIAGSIDDFTRELLNSLEEIPVRPAAPARTTAVVPEPTREVERGVHK
jgi:biopolymer transport protein TolQ